MTLCLRNLGAWRRHVPCKRERVVRLLSRFAVDCLGREALERYASALAGFTRGAQVYSAYAGSSFGTASTVCTTARRLSVGRLPLSWSFRIIGER